MKIRNAQKNYNAYNKNIINIKSEDLKIMKLYKPLNIFENNFSRKNIISNFINNSVNKTKEEIFPKIKRNYNKNIYSQIKIIPQLNIKK